VGNVQRVTAQCSFVTIYCSGLNAVQLRTNRLTLQFTQLPAARVDCQNYSFCSACDPSDVSPLLRNGATLRWVMCKNLKGIFLNNCILNVFVEKYRVISNVGAVTHAACH
jgi:hypothetical protein